jgi:hypothetical protein
MSNDLPRAFAHEAMFVSLFPPRRHGSAAFVKLFGSEISQGIFGLSSTFVILTWDVLEGFSPPTKGTAFLHNDCRGTDSVGDDTGDSSPDFTHVWDCAVAGECVAD